MIRKRVFKGKILKIQLWDTSGPERFRTITQSYYRGTNVILLCVSSDCRSLDNVNNWLSHVKEVIDENNMKSRRDNPQHIILIKTKCDLPDRLATVTKEEFKEFAVANGLPMFETSAKTGEGVEQAMAGAMNEMWKINGGDWTLSDVSLARTRRRETDRNVELEAKERGGVKCTVS